MNTLTLKEKMRVDEFLKTVGEMVDDTHFRYAKGWHDGRVTEALNAAGLTVSRANVFGVRNELLGKIFYPPKPVKAPKPAAQIGTAEGAIPLTIQRLKRLEECLDAAEKRITALEDVLTRPRSLFDRLGGGHAGGHK